MKSSITRKIHYEFCVMLGHTYTSVIITVALEAKLVSYYIANRKLFNISRAIKNRLRT